MKVHELGSHPGIAKYTAADVRGAMAASGITPNSEAALTILENLRPLADGESPSDRMRETIQYLDAEICGHKYPAGGDETHVAGQEVEMICLASPIPDEK